MSKELTELGQWKVGMLVHSFGDSITPETIGKITRITDGRGGTIYIGNTAYDINGNQRGQDVWHKHNIHPAVEEDIKRVKGHRAIARLSRYNWEKNLTPDKALQVEEMLKAIDIDISQ